MKKSLILAAASTFAEVTVIKEIQAVPIPADIPMAVAAIVAEPPAIKLRRDAHNNV